MNVEMGRQNIIILEITAAQFHSWEYVNRTQTFVLDSHRPFICSAGICGAPALFFVPHFSCGFPCFFAMNFAHRFEGRGREAGFVN